jgi:hypothetical protein
MDIGRRIRVVCVPKREGEMQRSMMDEFGVSQGSAVVYVIDCCL